MNMLISSVFGTATRWFLFAKKWVFVHKIRSAVIAIVILVAGWWVYGAVAGGGAETTYVYGNATRGTIVSSVSASGQVSASDEADLKSKVSGDVTWVAGLKAGDRVSVGQALASIESGDAQQSVVDARLAVEDARLTLEKQTLQAPIDYQQLKLNVENAERDLQDAYDNAYSSISDAFIKLPDVIVGADDFLYDEDISAVSQNVYSYKNLFSASETTVRETVELLADKAEEDYEAARNAYNAELIQYKGISRSSSQTVLDQRLVSTKSMTALIVQTLTSELNLADGVVDFLNQSARTAQPSITAAQSSTRTYLSNANLVLSSLSSAQKSLNASKDSLANAEHALAVASIGNPDGTQSFDLKLQQNTLRQKEAALADAERTLADHTIRAPFAGTLASLTVKRGDTLSNGTAVGSVITNQRIAELLLNEVDASTISVGDRATLTFDAFEDLTLTGQVSEIDAVGVVSQGVVSYTIRISFDATDPRIKPGMTVNAAIQTDVAVDVLMVPSSAVKTQNDQSVVQVMSETGELVSIPVVVGISDDTNVQIVSGLSEGQQVVVRTVSSSQTSSSQTTSSSARPPGGVFIR